MPFVSFFKIMTITLAKTLPYFPPMLCSIQDLSSPSRDGTCARCGGSRVLTTGPREKSLAKTFYMMLNRNSDSRHLCLVLILAGEAVSFSSLGVVLA